MYKHSQMLPIDNDYVHYLYIYTVQVKNCWVSLVIYLLLSNIRRIHVPGCEYQRGGGEAYFCVRTWGKCAGRVGRISIDVHNFGAPCCGSTAKDGLITKLLILNNFRPFASNWLHYDSYMGASLDAFKSVCIHLLECTSLLISNV